MSQTTHGTEFQREFEARWDRNFGKRGWCIRFTDSADLYGRNNNRVVNTDTAPADFLAGQHGWIGLVECKATTGNFTRSMIRRPQIIAATRSVAAGTPYYFAVKNMNTKKVYFVPASYVMNQGNKLDWSSLSRFQWLDDQTCPNLTT